MTPHIEGRNARDTNASEESNPFKDGTLTSEQWFDGWMERDIELYQQACARKRNADLFNTIFAPFGVQPYKVI